MHLDIHSIADLDLSPGPRHASGRRVDHFVEIYEEDSVLMESLARFVSTGLAKGEPVGLILSGEHAAQLEQLLSRGVDVAAAKQKGLFLTLDAGQILARFMDGEQPDPHRFEDVLQDILGALAPASQVRLFGEMVAVLWRRREYAAALALEDLWNQMGERYPFSLFCAYPATAFADKNVVPLGAVCSRHSHVITTVAEAR